LGEYFLSEALILFYDYINEFYNPLIEHETQITPFVSMVFLGFFFILSAALIAKYMKTYYKLLALALSIMFYEKIMEATIQIIEKFTKNMG